MSFRLFPALLVFAPFACAGIIATSSFNSSAESWTALTADSTQTGFPVSGPASVAFDPTGSISVTDPDSFDTIFSAPAAYLGGLSSAFGGTLRYDIRGDRAGDYNGVDVVIQGGGITLIYDSATLLGTNFQTFTVPLAPGAGWAKGIVGGPAATAADFQAALASVTALYIGAEFVFGVVETASLDNVVLAAPDPVNGVPEPPTALFFATGAAMLAFGWNRRARRK